jgi:hypothetical protein
LIDWSNLERYASSFLVGIIMLNGRFIDSIVLYRSRLAKYAATCLCPIFGYRPSKEKIYSTPKFSAVASINSWDK